MRIVLAQPIGARRRHIFRGEEAVVSLLETGRYAGLVERIQTWPSTSGRQFFDVRADDERKRPISNNAAIYGIYKALSLSIAHAVVPNRFPKVEAVHVSINGSTVWVAQYSTHMPDESGVGERIKRATARWYAAQENDRDAIRHAADHEEQVRQPQLLTLPHELAAKGLTLAHPEANYGIVNGNLVFYELTGISLPLVRLQPASSPLDESLAFLLLVVLNPLLRKERIDFSKGLRVFYNFEMGRRQREFQGNSFESYLSVYLANVDEFVKAYAGTAARRFSLRSYAPQDDRLRILEKLLD